jgi:hypothetical protein
VPFAIMRAELAVLPVLPQVNTSGKVSSLLRVSPFLIRFAG